MSYLLLAILCTAGISLVMRLGVDRVKNNLSMLSAGYLSCVLLSALYMALAPVNFTEDGMHMTLSLGLLAGVLLLAGFVILQKNIQLNGVVLSGIFSKLGVLVPTAVSVIFFGERPGLYQIVGFVLAILAILIIHSEKGRAKAASGLGLIFLLLFSGFADTMSKVYDELGNPNLRDVYLLLSFFSAFLLTLPLIYYKKQRFTRSDFLFGLLLGIPNYYSVRFLISALSEVPAVVAYPTFSVGSIVMISLMGVAFFREKITKRQYFAMGVIALALILLNI